jgi:hypothetical protein
VSVSSVKSNSALAEPVAPGNKSSFDKALDQKLP